MNQEIINNLLQTKDLISKLSQENYTAKLNFLENASIGQHVRHIIEFYQCLLQAKQTKQVNYDARKRDLKLETAIDFACESINDLIADLSEITKDFPVLYTADYSFSQQQKSLMIKTSFHRELAHNLEHSIHHQALIRIAVKQMNLSDLITNNFGYAPSTIRHLNKCAQ